jgi:hypothetical protein
VHSGDEFLILCLPFRRNDTEEYEIIRPGIPDVLPGSRRDPDYLACTDRSLFRSDMHLPVPAEDIVEFCGSFQQVREGLFSRGNDGMGDTAPEPGHFRDIIGMEEFAENGTVDDAFMGAVGTVADEHRVSPGRVTCTLLVRLSDKGDYCLVSPMRNEKMAVPSAPGKRDTLTQTMSPCIMRNDVWGGCEQAQEKGIPV